MRRFARVITVLVALAMAAGSVINAAQAASMTIDMAAATTHSDGAMPGCDGCPGGDDAGMVCASGCIMPLTAVIPAGPPIAETATQALLDSGARHLVGQLRPPDPYPPRTTVLG
jgi:hypothetical protein